MCVHYFGNFGNDFGSLSGIPLSTSISFTVGKESSVKRPARVYTVGYDFINTFLPLTLPRDAIAFPRFFYGVSDGLA